MEKDNLASYYFHQGTNFRSYEYMGCNVEKRDGKYVYSFRVWAPNARIVSIVGDFCGWDKPILMYRVTDKGVWELIYTSDRSLNYTSYKYLISGENFELYKADPYARYSKGFSDGASIIYLDEEYEWNDSNWILYRKEVFSEKQEYSYPVNVYELHLGSFLRKDDGTFYNYRALADILSPYIKAMGYTHIELLPISEYPYDGSWGYQVGAFYAPTSRYGTPEDFKYFVDKLHQSGIGIILDFVCAHFPKDEWGLYEFDGKPLYEYQGKDRQESRGWGTRFFDLGREEVQSFLISCALYYLREFHIDGLRVDAVASMLYLDYDRDDGEWVENVHGGKENLEAVAFFQKLNGRIREEFDDVLIIAEESGSFNGITRSVAEGGLGFDIKWNMGWANDFFEYLRIDPIYRKYRHSALNFPIMYAFNERYLLPISHDEVVHGKLSFVNKNFGTYEDKFLGMRSAIMLMMSYPGKKLLFMGTEFAQFREWNYADELEWFMLDYEKHREIRDYIRALNLIYLKYDAFWRYDFSYKGFRWVYADEAEKNIVAYERFGIESSVLVLINFSASNQSVEILCDKNYEYRCIFTSDNSEGADIKAEKEEIILPPFCGRIYQKISNKEKILL